MRASIGHWLLPQNAVPEPTDPFPAVEKGTIQTGQMDLAISSFILSFLSFALRQCALSQFLIQGPNVPGIAAISELV